MLRETTLWGIPAHEVVIPVFAWVFIFGIYIYQTALRAFDGRDALQHAHDPSNYYRNYFFYMRTGWIRKNHLTGQGAANSTRDYLRVLIFMQGTSASISALVLGYATILFDERDTDNRLLLVQLTFCSVLFSVVFFLFLISMRYAVQFHFLMNVDKDIHGVPLNLKIIDCIFHHSHLYYGAGLRLFYCAIPLFFWAMSSWALLGVFPFYIWMIKELDNNRFLEEELGAMYKGTKFGHYKVVKSSDTNVDEAGALLSTVAKSDK